MTTENQLSYARPACGPCNTGDHMSCCRHTDLCQCLARNPAAHGYGSETPILFRAGRTVMSRAFHAWLLDLEVDAALMLIPSRLIAAHVRLEPGLLDEHDCHQNRREVELMAGGGVLSAYIAGPPNDPRKVWVSTVGLGTEHLYTTIMFPEDY